LFVKIYCTEQMLNQNGRASTGKYKLRIANGIWVDEMSSMPEPPEDAPVQTIRGRRQLMAR